jgi:uracil-DNA glycosylase
MWSSPLFAGVPKAWREALEARLHPDVMSSLEAFVTREMETHVVFPPAPQIFRALEDVPPEQARVVILGQDPYPTRGHAHGLAFSVQAGTKLPRSLSNVFRELEDDLGLPAPTHGDLSAWSKQGVLLLNSVLTVREGEAGSHRNRGCRCAEKARPHPRWATHHIGKRAPLPPLRPKGFLEKSPL